MHGYSPPWTPAVTSSVGPSCAPLATTTGICTAVLGTARKPFDFVPAEALMSPILRVGLVGIIGPLKLSEYSILSKRLLLSKQQYSHLGQIVPWPKVCQELPAALQS